MTLRCLIAICAVLMKNRGLSKWLRAVNGISLRAKPAPCRGEGRGRELGCKSRNHPLVNHPLPAPIMARSWRWWRGKPNRTVAHLGLPGSAAGSVHPNSGLGLSFPQKEPNKLPLPHHLGALGAKHKWIQNLFQPSPCQYPPLGAETGGDTQSTRTGFLPQQIEAVNIDNLLFQGFLMPSHT